MKTKKKILDELIRVDHAGEFGAQQIYSGQRKFTRDIELKNILKKMALEEKEHFDYFESLMLKKRVRPTLMHPLWKFGGYSLGALTALLGRNYVMACTEAVENIIVDHYREQLRVIENTDNKELEKKIKKFLNDETKHQETGKELIQDNNLRLRFFKRLIKVLTKIAIKISKKI